MKISLLYRNWRGKISKRSLTPVNLFLGKNEYHPKETWLLEAIDHDKGGIRTFAIDGFDMSEELSARDAIIAELVGALESAQKTLSMMVDDSTIKSTTVATAYANCRASEIECRKALTKAKALTGGGK